MNTMSFLILALFIQFPSEFVVKEGFVKYRVNAKSFFGIMNHTIKARNDSVKGEFAIKDGKINGKLLIKSDYFISDNTRRDRDVSGMLESDKYPIITFEPLDLDTVKLEEILKSGKGKFKIKGKLTVRGVSKEYEMVIFYEKAGKDDYFLKTEIKAKFSDFGIKAPQIKGLGAVGKVITYAPDEIFLSGIIRVKREEE